MFLTKIRQDILALAEKLSDAVTRITTAHCGHAARITSLEAEIVQLRKDLDLEKAARHLQGVRHDAQIQEVGKSIDCLTDDMDDMVDAVYSTGETGPCLCDLCAERRILSGNPDAGMCSCEDCCQSDALPCKMSLVDQKAADDAFAAAYNEIKSDIEKERFASKVKKAKKGRKGKK